MVRLRMRNRRRTKELRDMFSETKLNTEDLVMPLFIKEGRNLKIPIQSMPGNFQFSPDLALDEIKQIRDLGLSAVLLFGIPGKKDSRGSEAFAENGIIQRMVSAIKKKIPGIIIITDVCLCEYTSTGHCGIVNKDGYVDNDRTIKLLGKIAVSHAQAGSDIVAPSAMMDFQVKAIREALNYSNHKSTLIMSYAAKYFSNFYSPFREAAESKPKSGDRSTYQMDYRNSDEALTEVRLDIEEGADIVMVKPALAYQDIIYRVKEKFSFPLACYNTSAEFSFVKAAGKLGWIDEKKVALEILTSLKRSGADIIITYFAKDAAKWLKKD